MPVIVISLFLQLLVFRQCHGGEYSLLQKLYETKLSNGSYNVNLRPLHNQSDVIRVKVELFLASAIEIDDVFQSFTFHALLHMEWTDELLTWDPEDYGNVTSFAPDIGDIWKPRLILTNSLNDRDPFKDNYAPLQVNSDGTVVYSPGGLMTTTCSLDMSQYPYDQQKCDVQFLSMLHDADEIAFYNEPKPNSKIKSSTFGEWELTNQETVLENEGKSGQSPTMTFTFSLSRSPYSFVVNILLPVMFIALLNILVFAIPVDSGEKISFGITVLLAQAVFMTILQSMLPTSSNGVPTVTIYVFALLTLSVLSVLSNIAVVHFHYKQKEDPAEPEVKPVKVPKNAVRSLPSTVFQDPLFPGQVFRSAESGKDMAFRGKTDPRTRNVPKSTNWKNVSRKINNFSFALTFLAWIISTILFGIYTSTGL